MNFQINQQTFFGELARVQVLWYPLEDLHYNAFYPFYQAFTQNSREMQLPHFKLCKSYEMHGFKL